jgi:hypothetical protein
MRFGGIITLRHQMDNDYKEDDMQKWEYLEFSKYYY